jgi:hypothetical protein
MPRRTIRQAKQVLEEAAPGLNPLMFRRYSDEIKAAEQAATQVAHGHAAKKSTKLLTQRTDVLRRLCETRDGFKELVAEGKAGRITGKDYADRFNALKAEERRLEAVIGDVEAGLATVEQIEEDPVAYADENFHDRYPATRPEFTF